MIKILFILPMAWQLPHDLLLLQPVVARGLGKPVLPLTAGHGA